MMLPEDKQLNIQALSSAFSNMSESYKLFWIKGILAEIKAGNKVFSFGDIINHMITDAWYMVSEFHLNLGPSDTLEKTVHLASTLSGLKPNSKESEIVSFIRNSEDKGIINNLKVLTLNVPYRFQAPFMSDFTGGKWKSYPNVIERVNGDDSLIYHFCEGKGLDTTICINDIWFDYFNINQVIIEGWINYNLINYLQRRNPNVPGIVNKLVPPSERKLESAKKYWKGVIEYVGINNIYANDDSLIKTTDISIDHFVPWSYVSHDELWNLVPTTRSLNSSKSNNLPNWDKYFPKLCDIEYLAYQALWENENIHKLFDGCAKNHLNSDEVRHELYQKNISKNEFSKRLESIILPSYIAAKKMGFTEWII